MGKAGVGEGSGGGGGTGGPEGGLRVGGVAGECRGSGSWESGGVRGSSGPRRRDGGAGSGGGAGGREGSRVVSGARGVAGAGGSGDSPSARGCNGGCPGRGNGAAPGAVGEAVLAEVSGTGLGGRAVCGEESGTARAGEGSGAAPVGAAIGGSGREEPGRVPCAAVGETPTPGGCQLQPLPRGAREFASRGSCPAGTRLAALVGTQGEQGDTARRPRSRWGGS